jgi:hypothetical protein
VKRDAQRERERERERVTSRGKERERKVAERKNKRRMRKNLLNYVERARRDKNIVEISVFTHNWFSLDLSEVYEVTRSTQNYPIFIDGEF